MGCGSWEAQMVWALTPVVTLIRMRAASFWWTVGMKHNHMLCALASATTDIATAQDCSSQLDSGTSLSSNKYQLFLSCLLFFTFSPSFQAFVLEGQGGLHFSLRQVSSRDTDGMQMSCTGDWLLSLLSHHAIVPPSKGVCIAQEQSFPGKGICTAKVHRQSRLGHG